MNALRRAAPVGGRYRKATIRITRATSTADCIGVSRPRRSGRGAAIEQPRQADIATWPELSDSGRVERRPAQPRRASFGHGAAARSATCSLRLDQDLETRGQRLLRWLEPEAARGPSDRFVAALGGRPLGNLGAGPAVVSLQPPIVCSAQFGDRWRV